MIPAHTTLLGLDLVWVLQAPRGARADVPSETQAADPHGLQGEQTSPVRSEETYGEYGSALTAGSD